MLTINLFKPACFTTASTLLCSLEGSSYHTDWHRVLTLHGQEIQRKSMLGENRQLFNDMLSPTVKKLNQKLSKARFTFPNASSVFDTLLEKGS